MGPLLTWSNLFRWCNICAGLLNSLFVLIRFSCWQTELSGRLGILALTQAFSLGSRNLVASAGTAYRSCRNFGTGIETVWPWHKVSRTVLAAVQPFSEAVHGFFHPLSTQFKQLCWILSGRLVQRVSQVTGTIMSKIITDILWWLKMCKHPVRNLPSHSENVDA